MSTAIIKPEWSFVTIALMVLGFIVFWPLGLAMLAYILWGEMFGGSADKADRWVHKQKEWARNCRTKGGKHWHNHRHTSGNAAFDDYREEQLKRLEEERRRLDDEIAEFHDYMRNLHKARDREEFDRFMRDRAARRDPSDNDGHDGGPEGPSGNNDDHRQGY